MRRRATTELRSAQVRGTTPESQTSSSKRSRSPRRTSLSLLSHRRDVAADGAVVAGHPRDCARCRRSSAGASPSVTVQVSAAIAALSTLEAPVHLTRGRRPAPEISWLATSPYGPSCRRYRGMALRRMAPLFPLSGGCCSETVLGVRRDSEEGRHSTPSFREYPSG